jgi:DNA-binding IclR family transcriptional regulator
MTPHAVSDDPTTPPTRQGIGSVETAARVLFALEEAGGPLSLNEVAQRCHAQPSKIHRYLVSLGRAGLTTQSRATGKYDLGPATRRLGSEALRRTNDIAIASERTQQLSEATGHSVNLSVWSDNGPTIVRWDYGEHALSLTARVGATLPLLDSAVGQVFLAHIPRAMTAPLLKRALEGRAVADAEAVAARVRADGYGTSVGGVIAGLTSYAAPVFTGADALAFVIALACPRHISPAQLTRARQRLLETTAALSKELGSA